MKQLIVLTPPDFIEHEAKLLTALFEAGMTHLHIRKPGCTALELEKLIRQLPERYYASIVLHDHFILTMTYKLGGIHLNRRNTDIPEGFIGSVSKSCHSWDELVDIATYSYVFLSPIFTSISKEGYDSAFTLQELEQAAAKSLINEKVIALGGMDSATIPFIANLPFGGVAVLGALWERRYVTNLVERFRSLETTLNNQTR